MSAEVNSLETCPNEFIGCHAYGHAWENEALLKEGYHEQKKVLFGVREVCVCLRCGTRRSALFKRARWIRRTSYNYQHPSGYSGYGVVARAEWRLELLRRTRTKNPRPTMKGTQ